MATRIHENTNPDIAKYKYFQTETDLSVHHNRSSMRWRGQLNERPETTFRSYEHPRNDLTHVLRRSVEPPHARHRRRGPEEPPYSRDAFLFNRCDTDLSGKPQSASKKEAT